MADFPGGIPHRDDLDRSCRIARSTSRAATATPAWVNSRALELAGIDRRHAGPARRPDRARRRRRAVRHAPGGRGRPRRSDCFPRTTPDELVAGLRLAQAELHALGITDWQDAIVTPRRRRDRLRDAGRSRRADGPRRRARCGGTERAAPSRSRSSSSGAPGPRVGRYRADQRQVLRSTASSRTSPARCSSRTSTATAARPTNRGIEHDRARGAQDARDPARRARLPAALPRDRRPGRARGARRGRGRPAARTARPTRGRTSPTSRSSTRTTSRASARSASIANAQPLLGGPRGPDGRADDPASSGRSGRAGSTRSARCCGRRAPRDGLRLERLDRRSAARDGGRGHPGQRRRTAASEPPFLPDRAARPRWTPSRRSRWARRWVNHLESEVGLDRGRQGGRPGRPRSRPVRPRRPARSARRAWSPRSSTASRSTRRPRSRADGAAVARAWTA